MNLNDERKAFEEWCVENDEFCIHRHTDYCQKYSDDYTQSAWLAWQASTQRQGYKLVPILKTDDEKDESKYMQTYTTKP